MFSSGNQLSYLLGISAYVSLYGIACLLVWFIGSSFGFAVTTQIIVIALILLTLPVAILINHFRKKRALKKEAAAQAQAEAGTASAAPADKTPVAPKRVYDELLRGAEEAVQWLRSSRLGGTKANEAVYALPWFVVAGPSASGKTSLLLSSGLDFHALPSQRRAELKIVRPTRNSEWRMTDSAVWIDTAGRYQNDGLGREEWLALAETIKKHRTKRPLDGLLLVVNADRLLHSSDAEIEQQAKTIRARVDELMRLARVKFPVYLVFTNMDRVPGFSDFFSLNGDDNRTQVWGATIPLEKAANAHALFDSEFDLLRESLMRRRLLRLRKPAAAAAQLRTFVFPLRFSEARDRLGLFSSALFRPNPFSESPLLRGFYFTANLNNSSEPRRTVEEEEAERSAHAVGEPYFTNRLFRDVVLRDKDLAGSFQAAQKHPPRLSVILTAAASVLLLCLTAAGVISFLNNRQLITDATDRGVMLALIAKQDSGKDPLTKDTAAARVELEATESLRETLAQLDEYDQSSPPLYMRFGFYSGDVIKDRLREIYFTSIDQRYVKPSVAKMKADLQSFASGAARNVPIATTTTEQGTDSTNEDFLGRHYDILKAYLMMAHANRVEPTFLANQLQEYWKKSAQSELNNISQKQLDFFARQAVYDDAPHNKADDQLVAEVRQKLVAYPPLKRFYKRVITDINAKTTPVSLDSILQGRSGGILSSTYTVPGSFTIDGYRNHMLAAFDSAAEEISKDDWVMATVASSAPAQITDPGTLKTMYLKEYTDQWRRFLRGISVQPFKTSNDAVTALKAFSDSESPIQRVLETVASNTNLSAKEKSSGTWAWIKSFFSSKATPDTGPQTEVEAEFRPVYQYLAFGENKKDDSRMSLYRTELGNLLRSIDQLKPDQLAELQKAVSSGKDEIGLQKTADNIQRSLDDFKTPAAADAAALLNQPLSALKRFFYGAGYEQIEKEWAEQLYPKAHALEANYPFTQSGQTSVIELTEFLNPNSGQLANFFKTRLASSFEGSPGTWKPKGSAPFSFSDDFVKYLNDSARLTEALFPNNGAQPVTYELELQPVPDAVTKITIDGTSVEAQGTSATTVPFTWPAKSGVESGARITVTSGAEVSELRFNGQWGVFQMFDAGSPSQSATGYALTWKLESFTVRATLRPDPPTKNPFNRQLFRDLHAPQKIEK